MDAVFKKFYTSFYVKTGGYFPAKPLNQPLYPGDFFQIHRGEIIVLGNIFRNGIIDATDSEFEYGIKLNPASWNFSEGVTKPYSGRDSGHNPVEGDFKFSKQILAFDDFGSFFFKSVNPEQVKIANWSSLQQELIIKLTQVLYSFRELYVVTESVTPDSWTLAISGSDKGELEIATESESFGLVDLFGDANAKTVQAREIEFYHREVNKKPTFFKAKKLIVQPQKLDIFISELITSRLGTSAWVNDFYDYDFFCEPSELTSPFPRNAQACVLDMLQANQLNPNTALLYFAWSDASLDDVEKLFITYGS